MCTADPGWITGHSYVVYGPLINGATVLLAEGAFDFPDPGRWWSIVEKYGVNIFYSTPTAIRALMRFGDEWPAKYDLSFAQSDGHRRRTDQSRSVAVVSRKYRHENRRRLWIHGGKPKPANS